MVSKAAKIFTSNKLIKDNSVAFIGSMIAAGINYLFYPVLGRFLSTTQFGEVQVLATLTVQAGLIFGLARIAIIGEVLQAKTKDQSIKVAQFAERLLLQLAILMTVLAAITAPLLAKMLQLESVGPLYILLPSLAFSAVRSSRDSYTRAHGHFGYAAITDVVTALVKLILAAILAAIGLGTVGALLGLIGAYGAALVIAIVVTTKLGMTTNLKSIFSFDTLRSVFKKGTVSRRGVSTLSVSAASLVVVVISSIDTVFSKFALPPQTAGLYTGISVVGNIALFATGSIAGVLLASVSPTKDRSVNTRKYILSILLTCGLGLSIVTVSVLAPNFVITTMLGQKYAELSNLLPALSVAMFAMGCINLIISYHIAMRDLAILTVAILVGCIVGMFLFMGHDTAAQIADSFLKANVLSLILCIGWTLYWHKRAPS